MKWLPQVFVVIALAGQRWLPINKEESQRARDSLGFGTPYKINLMWVFLNQKVWNGRSPVFKGHRRSSTESLNITFTNFLSLPNHSSLPKKIMEQFLPEMHMLRHMKNNEVIGDNYHDCTKGNPCWQYWWPSRMGFQQQWTREGQQKSTTWTCAKHLTPSCKISLSPNWRGMNLMDGPLSG